MEKPHLTLNPYLYFEGNCEEALQAYQSIFGGTIKGINRYQDGPMEVPGDYKNKVLHGHLQFGDSTLMASDIFPNSPIEKGNSFVLSIGLTDEAQAKEIFKQLAEGGKITCPWSNNSGEPCLAR